MQHSSLFRLSAPLWLALLAVASCSSPAEPRQQRVIGFIDSGGLPVDALSVPETAQAGVSFNVTVATFGSSCLRPDGAEVTMTASVAEITPYDLAPNEPPPCPSDWQAFPRTVALTFASPGDHLVRLLGRGFSGPMVLEETVSVLP